MILLVIVVFISMIGLFLMASEKTIEEDDDT